MRTQFALLILFLIFSAKGMSQGGVVSIDSVMKAYNEKAIYMRNSRYVQGGEKLPYGVILTKFKKTIEGSPDAMEAFDRYRAKSLIGAGIMLISVPAGIAISIASASPAGLFVFLGLYTAGLVLALDAQNQLHESVWLYNRDILRQVE